jgi:hypothetical protein
MQGSRRRRRARARPARARSAGTNQDEGHRPGRGRPTNSNRTRRPHAAFASPACRSSAAVLGSRPRSALNTSIGCRLPPSERIVSRNLRPVAATACGSSSPASSNAENARRPRAPRLTCSCSSRRHSPPAKTCVKPQRKRSSGSGGSTVVRAATRRCTSKTDSPPSGRQRWCSSRSRKPKESWRSMSEPALHSVRGFVTPHPSEGVFRTVPALPVEHSSTMNGGTHGVLRASKSSSPHPESEDVYAECP